MKSQASDPLPQRIRELVGSVEAILASLPDEPNARAAAMVKIKAHLDAVELEVQRAPKPERSSLKQAVLRFAGGIALREILDILLRVIAPSRRLLHRRVTWA